MATKSRGATVMSVLKLLVWVVIAAAFVKFAFFPATQADDSALYDPAGVYEQTTVTAEKGTITNTITLEGTIQSDPAPAARATLDGEVTEIYVNDGQQVGVDDAILLIQKQVPGDDVITRDPEGNEIVTPGKPYWKSSWVLSPAAGTVHLNALMGQNFAIGDTIATVQPPTFSARATLTPDQMYRIVNVPGSAKITIKNGPAPFDCAGLTVSASQSSNGSGSTPGKGTTPTTGEGTPSGIQARCAIPDGVKVFPGLQVTMEIVAGEAADVWTLPISAVEGRFQNGYVYAPGSDPNTPQKIQVKLGLTDGKRVEIIEGLAEGQAVLEFIPGQQPTEMKCNPMTGEGC